jgi:hypothetical protein
MLAYYSSCLFMARSTLEIVGLIVEYEFLIRKNGSTSLCPVNTLPKILKIFGKMQSYSYLL